LGTPYGIYLRHNWEHLGEQPGDSENLMGTLWEHIGNRKKTIFFFFSPLPKKKKILDPS